MTEKLSVQQPIAGLNGLTLGDFWSWAYSDVLNNRNRSILAEFLVAAALGVLDEPRVEWDAVDLSYHDKRIEVKSAAYLQSWEQERLSVIRFDIARKRGWDAAANLSASKPTRSADAYVFCLYFVLLTVFDLCRLVEPASAQVLQAIGVGGTDRDACTASFPLLPVPGDQWHA